MHVRAGTNKDEVCLGRNTTPPPSSWTAHAKKRTNKEKQTCKAYNMCKNAEKWNVISGKYHQKCTLSAVTEPGGAELKAAAVL